MLEVLKIAVLYLICIIITALFSTLLLTGLLFILLTFLFYDFDFETTLERHAIIKVKHAYLKVRNFYQVNYHSFNNSTRLIHLSDTTISNNRSTMEFDLSRFNKSGSVYSPIPKIGNSTTLSTRLQPAQTSTPLTRNSPWQKNSTTSLKTMPLQNSPSLHRSPRYSLSSTGNNTPKTTSNNTSSTSAIQTIAGPLLASTRFNINLGTYTDTKSPGLANRVVQYHNESQLNQSQTHQAKYGSPGQFPIVQLYKKELPLLTRTTRRCTVRIAPPDSVAYNTTEAKSILRESFVQNNAENNLQKESEINTKSVLDALKEISRKRIHANDDIEDLTKRQRKGSLTANLSSTDNNNKDGKRLREDTPPKPKGAPVSPSANIPKKICVTNEIECSLSSSILMRLQGQKRKAAVGTILNTNKQRKIGDDEDHLSKQTQTNLNVTNSSPVTNSTQTNFSETSFEKSNGKLSKAAQTEEKDYRGLQSVLQNSRRRKKEFHERSIKEIDEVRAKKLSEKLEESPAPKPLFNPEPLEIIRKNRLAMVMAAFNGDKPEYIPLPNLTLTQMKESYAAKEQKESSEVKTLPSILSPKNKVKHDKHVTFDIPSSESNGLGNDKLPADDSNNNATSAAVVVTSPSAKFTDSGHVFSLQNLTKPAVTAMSVTSLASGDATVMTVMSSMPTASMSFASSVSPSIFASSGVNLSMTDSIKPTFSTVGMPASSNSITFGTVTTNSVSNDTVTTPVINNSVQPSSITFGATQNSKNVNSIAGSGSSLPMFGGITSSIANSTSPHVSSLTSAAVTTTPMPSINFGFPVSTSAPPMTFNSLPVSSAAPPAFSQQSTTSNQSAFGTSQPIIAFGTNTQTSSSTTGISFGTPATTSQTVAPFGTQPATTSNVPTSTPSPFSFGTTAETTAPASNPTFTFGNSKPNLSPPKIGGFKFDLVNPAPSSAPVTTADTSKTSSVFGDTGLNKGAFTFGSGNNSSTSVFGAPTTTSSLFGGSNSTTSAPAFGTPKTTENAPGFGVFGNTQTTQTASFGTFSTPTTSQNASGFGTFSATQTPKTTNSFGAPAPTTTTSFAFGNTNAAAKPFTFNTTTTASSVFGNTGSTFGSPAPSGSVFGTPTTTASVVPSGSGVFGTPNTTSTTANLFGAPAVSTTASVFGTNTTTTTANPFGQPSTNVFGNTTTGFGNSANTGSVFGAQSTNAFGASSPPNAFGSPPNQAPFGSTTNQGVFGGSTSNQPNIFGSTSTSRPLAFGSTGNTGFGGGFGAATPAQPPAAGGFGASALPAPTPNVFGASTNPPAATGAFGSTSSQPAAGGFPFGASTSQTPAQQQPGVFAFGSPAQSAAAAAPSNAFQFGGTSTPAKPSGFNFSAGATSPNLNFGASTSAPAFGATPAPAFGSPNAMFNIGSGSTAPKQRPMIKARRRNN